MRHSKPEVSASVAESASDASKNGTTTESYLVKYATSGNPFDIAAEEDEKEEDVMDLNGVRDREGG